MFFKYYYLFIPASFASFLISRSFFSEFSDFRLGVGISCLFKDRRLHNSARIQADDSVTSLRSVTLSARVSSRGGDATLLDGGLLRG